LCHAKDDILLCSREWVLHAAGKIRGLHGHRWLVVACDTKLLMHDLSSNLSREVARTALDGKAPTSVAFMYINNPGLLGQTVGSAVSMHAG